MKMYRYSPAFLENKSPYKKFKTSTLRAPCKSHTTQVNHLRESYGVNVITVTANVTTPEGLSVSDLLSAANWKVDTLVNNAGGPCVECD